MSMYVIIGRRSYSICVLQLCPLVASATATAAPWAIQAAHAVAQPRPDLTPGPAWPCLACWAPAPAPTEYRYQFQLQLSSLLF